MHEKINRFSTMADAYDAMAQIMVPHYNWLQDEMIRLLPWKRESSITIIDLGAGSGIMLEKLLTIFKNSRAFWIDFSEDFMVRAQSRLDRFGDRVTFIKSSFSESWETEIETKADLVCSMSAIHHLPALDKRALYTRCFNILSDGGMFFNIDEMKTSYSDSYLSSMQFWWNHVQNAQPVIPDELQDICREWMSHFTNWKIRNIDNIDKPKKAGDDMHDHYSDQVGWLHDIGFKGADLFIKYHLWCIIGGTR